MSPRTIPALGFLLATSLSCSLFHKTRPELEPPPPDLRPTIVNYIDSDGFDEFLEATLTNEDPVILIQTGSAKPNWGPRLSAWLAVWNLGGKVERKARAQIPVVTINAASIHEFRLLIDNVMGRTENAARAGSTWFRNERMLRRRVELLRPYNLRFHVDRDGFIQIILFNGRYSRYHREFVRSTAHPDDEVPEEWARGWSCSHCRREE